jgi:hypothetical protein
VYRKNSGGRRTQSAPLVAGTLETFQGVRELNLAHNGVFAIAKAQVVMLFTSVNTELEHSTLGSWPIGAWGISCSYMALVAQHAFDNAIWLARGGSSNGGARPGGHAVP